MNEKVGSAVLLVCVCVLLGCDSRAVYEPAEWVTIESGTFEMGSPATEVCREIGKFKETLHKVTLTRSFEIPTTEVSQGQFEARLDYNPSNFPECGPDCPVDGVSWSEAAAYCNALSREDGLPECYQCGGKEGEVYCEEEAAYLSGKIYTCPGYRLPTEAEWEYACRAGSKTGLPNNGDVQECTAWDSNANNAAWYQANSGQNIHLAKQKKENAWGLFDMTGNVWEWTNDWFEDDLGSDVKTDPAGPSMRTLGRVLRGGSAEVPAHLLRCASRHNYAPPDSTHRLRFHGLRCVRPPND